MKGTILASTFCLVLLAGCSNSEGKAEPTAVPEKKVEKELTQEEKDKKFAENVASASTLDEAVSRAAPKLGVEFQDRYGIFVTGSYKTAGDSEDDYQIGLNLKASF